MTAFASAASRAAAMTGPIAFRLLSRPKCRPAQVRSVLHPILMCAHRKSHSLGVLFANNKPDAASCATSDDDAVLIPGEPEARDIGGRDRIAVDFVVSHHDWSPLIASEAFGWLAEC